jgi:diacylglycerol kinase (ATP)
MLIGLVYNRASGMGRGAATAPPVADSLRTRGHEVRTIEVGRGLHTPDALAAALQGVQAVVVVGGDGTVHHTAEAAIAADAPVYHFPTGNENLFAREFGMDRDPATLLRALDRMHVVRMDLGRVAGADAPAPAGRLFLLMCSLGPDASVIHRLAKVRSKAVGHRMYLGPLLAELARPSFPRLTIRIDGRAVVEDRCGIAVVANCRQYALRIDPAHRACLTDGLLDVVFFPCASRTRMLVWTLASRLRRHERHSDLVYRTSRTIEIDCTSHGGDALYQVDGEAVPPPDGAACPSLRLWVDSAKLPVLSAL